MELLADNHQPSPEGKQTTNPVDTWQQMPRILKLALDQGFVKDNNRLHTVLALLNFFSGNASNVFTFHHGGKYNTNFFLIMPGKSGTGKGFLSSLQSHIYEEEESLNSEFEIGSGDDSLDERWNLTFSLDSSSAGLSGALYKNDGSGWIVDTEIITGVTSSGMDYARQIGSFVLKAFQNEIIDISRKEMAMKFKPNFSIALTGVEDAVLQFFENATDGKLARMMILPIVGDINFDPKTFEFSEEQFDLEAEEELKKHLHNMMLLGAELKRQGIRFIHRWEPEQARELYLLYNDLFDQAKEYEHEGLEQIIFRTALQHSKLAGLISYIRYLESTMLTGEIPEMGSMHYLSTTSHDQEFIRAVMMETLPHMKEYFFILPKRKASLHPKLSKLSLGAAALYKALPDNKPLTRPEIVEFKDQLSVSERTIDKYRKALTDAGLLKASRFGEYVKVDLDKSE